jgi:hypothetical protein
MDELYVLNLKQHYFLPLHPETIENQEMEEGVKMIQKRERIRKERPNLTFYH